MVWGAFSDDGYTQLIRIQGNLDSNGYVEILRHGLLPAWGTLLPNGGLFQQDNAPIHRSQITSAFLDNSNVNRLPWPALSPDMNPIENVWGIMSKEIDKVKIENADQLFDKLVEIWQLKMSDMNFRHSLINSMPQRVKALKDAGGGPTKY